MNQFAAGTTPVEATASQMRRQELTNVAAALDRDIAEAEARVLTAQEELSALIGLREADVGRFSRKQDSVGVR